MAVNDVAELLAKANEDEELKKTALEALEGSTDPQDFVELAKRQGYDVTADEVELFFQKLLSAQPPEELSDADLEEVAGGKDVHYSPKQRLDLVSGFTKGFQTLPSWMRGGGLF